MSLTTAALARSRDLDCTIAVDLTRRTSSHRWCWRWAIVQGRLSLCLDALLAVGSGPVWQSFDGHYCIVRGAGCAHVANSHGSTENCKKVNHTALLPMVEFGLESEKRDGGRGGASGHNADFLTCTAILGPAAAVA
jgi:hypothetical protein